MFEFRLGSIPVRVHPSHLLTSALLGLLFMGDGGSNQWPGAALAAGGSERLWAMAAYIGSWVFIIFVSVLIHELGHALLSLAFGYRPDIELVWMGGHTRPNAPGQMPWGRDIVITAAGPLFGLTLAAVSFVLLQVLEPSAGTLGHHLLFWFALANVFWAVLNLFPVMPLDGGRISMVALSRAFGQKGFVASQVLALLICAAVVFLGLQRRYLFLTVFFGLYAVQAWQLLRAAMRSEVGPDAVHTHPAFEQARQAMAQLVAGKLDEARRTALPLTEATGVPPQLRSLAHKVLGWVAVKEGEGRRALDHFSQVSGEKVEEQALAAAFSLIGDDARALPLWEQAWRETKDRTVLHEWAGALWREGKREEALAQPGVDPLLAATFATRVPYIRGDFLRAARLGEEALAWTPDYAVAYDAACAYARAQAPEDALRLLQEAEKRGFVDAERAREDADLGSLSAHPGFGHWLEGLGAKRVALTQP